MPIAASTQTPPNLWDEALIKRYDLAGPRYTSYPTAPQFSESFTVQNWHQAMDNSNTANKPLSLYFHIPFCATVCYYCGCNKVITANRERSKPYLSALLKEISLQASYANTSRPVNQLHWGGGTPTYLSDTQMRELMTHTQKHFKLHTDDSGEYSIEIHPQTVNPERLALLRSLGFNRLSIGVQDFNPDVQKAVNRFNTEKEVVALINASKTLGYNSVSMDLIYGLPKQTVKSFAHTLESVIAMRPDRLSLFNYAHMPHLFKVQKQINSNDLPAPKTKLAILHNSINQLLDAGYQYIGMDHFALPTDELAKAQNAGTLHRNFQGYATHGNCDLLGFGVSAINSLADTYAQNHKNIEDYTKAVETGKLPIIKGYSLNQDDKIRRNVINALACQFEIDFDQFEKNWGLSFHNYFAKEVKNLAPLQADGLINIQNNALKVLPKGQLLVRRICMSFDSYLQAPQQDAHNTTNTDNATNIIASNAARYSRII